MNKYVVEFIGTFFLVLTVGLAAGHGHGGNLAGLAIGGVLMVMIFAGGHISGGHFNPAVTLSVWIRGKLPASDLPGYWIAQAAAGVVAALCVGYLTGGAEVKMASYEVGPTLLAEFLFTFALCWVVLNAATASGTDGNSFYGLAIGFTVTAGAYSVGPISGAVFNPAVAIGISVIGMSAWASIWIFLAANLIGGTAAAMAFKSLADDS